MPPRHHRHLDAADMMLKVDWEKGCECTSILPGTNFSYVMMMRGCMHVNLSIKKVMSMQHVRMYLLIIIIKNICQPLLLPHKILHATLCICFLH